MNVMNVVSNKTTIRLLLVDDDQVDRLACKRSLAQHPSCDFVIFEAEAGVQGLELARTEKIDCILLDYHLPDFNGVEFLAELAKETGELPIPVIMLTGSDNALVAVDALRLGARDYVVKGSERESLQWLPAMVFRALREQQAIQDKAVAVQQLCEAEAKYRTLVEQIPAITYIASLESAGKLLYLSPQIQQMGFPPEEWLADPQGLLRHVHAEDRQIMIDAYTLTYEHHAPLRCEYRLVKHDGQARWFLDEANVVRDEAGGSLFLQGILVDITADKEAEEELAYYRRNLESLVAHRTKQLEKQSDMLKAANTSMGQELSERKRIDALLRQSEARFRLLLESVGEGILGLDAEGRCTFVNPAALVMLGYTREELLGQDIHAMIHGGSVDGFPVAAGQWGINNAFRDGVPQRSPEIFRRKDGHSFPVECSAYPMQIDVQVTGAVLIFRDVTESLCYQATHDSLTGLINRTEFEQRTARALTSALDDQSEHALCYLDLDQFKIINDTCGHAAGDELLRTLATLLQSKLRQRDTMARLGGDEFVLLIEHCTIDQAWSIANELCESVRDHRFICDSKPYSVSVSIGIAMLTSAAGDVAAVLSAADAACYMAKEMGRNQVQIFQSNDDRISKNRVNSQRGKLSHSDIAPPENHIPATDL
jgi:diguanylate cyclase (GGDEF)-like protein/PAS domain S-box-containing protein